ncbi:MAG TPA: thioredoxin domain-containing protein [Chitinophagaceae bacterium]
MRYGKDIAPVIPQKDIVIGDPAAPVTLEEFGDYESVECAQAAEVVKEILEKYDGRVKFIFRHFPLTSVHQKAHKAAEAAIGAAQEGRFWEMHHTLFDNRRNLGTISLKSYARESGVTNKRYLDELINSTWGVHVQDDLREGLERGVRNIPTFFVNDVLFEGPATVKALSAVIDMALAEEERFAAVPKKKRA